MFRNDTRNTATRQKLNYYAFECFMQITPILSPVKPFGQQSDKSRDGIHILFFVHKVFIFIY